MKIEMLKTMRGQSLVFFVIIVVALLGFIAVVIDGSNIYAMRRLAQNAADAGALAGARQLCVTSNTLLASSTAEDYATTKNLAKLPNTLSQTASASVTGGYVDVSVDILYGTFFARILGMNQLHAVANAQAGCFPPGGAQGESVIPIAWKCPNLQWTTGPGGQAQQFCDLDANIPPDTSCTLGEDSDGVDDMIYILWDYDPDKPEQIWCNGWNETPPEGSSPIYIDCDIDGDGDEDVYPISPLQPEHKWYWFNTNGGSCGTSEENNIIRYGLTYPIYPHTWYPGCTGDRVSVYDAVADHRAGEDVLLPVFSQQCTGAELASNLEKCQIHGNDTILEPSYNGEHFHLVSFGVFHINCVDAGSNKCTDSNIHARAALLDVNKDVKDLKLSSINSIEGCFIEDFVSGIIGDPSGVVTGAWTIYLTK